MLTVLLLIIFVILVIALSKLASLKSDLKVLYESQRQIFLKLESFQNSSTKTNDEINEAISKLKRQNENNLRLIKESIDNAEKSINEAHLTVINQNLNDINRELEEADLRIEKVEEAERRERKLNHQKNMADDPVYRKKFEAQIDEDPSMKNIFKNEDDKD